MRTRARTAAITRLLALRRRGAGLDHGAVALGVGVDDDADEVERGEVDERVDHRVLGLLARAGEDRLDGADGDARRRTARRSAAAPGDDARRPCRGLGVVDEVEVEAAASPTSPRPRRKPTSALEPSRAPTTDSWSTTSSTVAVPRSARITRPTSPSLLSTVMSGWMPELVPASMVTVRENDWAGPMRDHPGRDQREAGAGRAAQQPVELGGAVADLEVVASCAAQVGVLGLEPRDVVAQAPLVAEEAGDLAGTGVRRWRWPPRRARTRPAATARTGSSGESSPPW